MISVFDFTRFRLTLFASIWFTIIGIISFFAFKHAGITHENLWIDIVTSALIIFAAIDVNYLMHNYAPNVLNKLYARMSFIGISIAFILLMQYFLTPFIYGDLDGEKFYFAAFYYRVLLALIHATFFSIIFWMSSDYKNKIDKKNRLQESENLLRAAELIKLRQQLQPHFLFNSLNSINSLVITEPKQARAMILNLSDFLRGTLKDDENKMVSLADEINLLNLYLKIEQVRFGHRLSIENTIETGSELLQIPALLLQPVVENAIKFGLYNTLENITISIKAYAENNQLHIVIANPYQDSPNEVKKGAGFGLNSIQRRLQLLFHRNDLLKTKKENNIFETHLIIPQ